MKRIEDNVAVTFHEGQGLVGVLQQLYLGDVCLHQEVRVQSHLWAGGAEVLTFVISVRKSTCIKRGSIAFI